MYTMVNNKLQMTHKHRNIFKGFVKKSQNKQSQHPVFPYLAFTHKLASITLPHQLIQKYNEVPQLQMPSMASTSSNLFKLPSSNTSSHNACTSLTQRFVVCLKDSSSSLCTGPVLDCLALPFRLIRALQAAASANIPVIHSITLAKHCLNSRNFWTLLPRGMQRPRCYIRRMLRICLMFQWKSVRQSSKLVCYNTKYSQLRVYRWFVAWSAQPALNFWSELTRLTMFNPQSDTIYNVYIINQLS